MSNVFNKLNRPQKDHVLVVFLMTQAMDKANLFPPAMAPQDRFIHVINHVGLYERDEDIHFDGSQIRTHADAVSLYVANLAGTSEDECVICHEAFPMHTALAFHGHNPAPISDTGRCCDSCNATVVIPARIAQAS